MTPQTTGLEADKGLVGSQRRVELSMSSCLQDSMQQYSIGKIHAGGISINMVASVQVFQSLV
jgi:hypothetical protein